MKRYMLFSSKIHFLIAFLLIGHIPLKATQYFTRGTGYWTTAKDEAKKGFFQLLTPVQSQRESWYTVTPYIAEFWCALSNVGFFYAGIKHACPELIIAGTASILSHSIPLRWLLMVDKIGVLLVLVKALRTYQCFLDQPACLIPVIGAGLMNMFDLYMARKHSKTWPHVLWHLAAAYCAHCVLSYDT